MQVSKDKIVTFHYTLKDKESGEIIDSSVEYGEPVKVIFGRNLLIEGLERGMMGMEGTNPRRPDS